MACIVSAMYAVVVATAGDPSVIGLYRATSPEMIPDGFAAVCKQQGWDTEQTWLDMNGLQRPWFKHSTSDAYIYYNVGNQKWWIDAPNGEGRYIATENGEHGPEDDHCYPPEEGWTALDKSNLPVPTVKHHKIRHPSHQRQEGTSEL
jgi:hypothetical protein